MATLEEVLKKINKNKAEEDKIKANPKKGELTTDFSSTGSVYLDYILEQKAIPLGRMTLMTGWESSGKSSVALIAAREIQKKTDKTVVIMDGEHTVSDSHIDRFNLDRKKLIVYKESNLEQMLDTTEALSTADDIGGIVIDSVKAFYSSAVEAKSAEDIHIGIEAKKIGSRFSIVHSNCARRKIAFIVLNQWRENPGSMGDPRVLPGGNWNKYMPCLHLDFTKKDLIKNKDAKVIGHNLDVRVKKSKFGAFDKKEVYTVNFYYNGGFNSYDEYARLFVETEIALAKGAWIKYPNKDGEELKANGLNKFIEQLKNDEETFNYLKNLLWKN